MDLGLQGRGALVTGATRGLGRAIADELTREGANVAICARNRDEVEATIDELRAHGTTVYGRVADVRNPDDVRAFIGVSADALGGFDILVNNAGRAHPGDFDALTDDDWHSDLDVKLFAMIRCSREAIPHLRARGKGRIININAVLGKYPHPSFFATSVNRAACLAFTKALAMQLGSENILVNSINIGYVRSSQWKDIQARRAPDLPQQEFFQQIMAGEVPLGRFGEPEEVASLVAFLAGDRASYITGASIDVAGGWGRYL